MCGIAGIYLKDPFAADLPPNVQREKFIDELLLGIENRGRDATGVVALQRASTQAHLEKADIDATEFIKWRRPLPADSRIVLLHTRAATKGSPKNLDNNHPVVHKTCFVTHNGHIRNDDDLFKDNAFERIAQVDSEIIPALIDKHGLDKVHLALQELDGGFAIAAVQPEVYPDLLVLAKGRNSPLNYIETEQAIVWASTAGAIRDAWKEVWGDAPAYSDIHSLFEGELLYIEDGKVEKMKFKVKQPPVTKWSASSSWTNGSTFRGYNRTGEDSYLARYSNSQNHRRTCKCGHSQWSHGGTDLKSFCIKGDCRCTHFVFGRFLAKKEWKRYSEYTKVQEQRLLLETLRAEEKAEEKQRKDAVAAARKRTTDQEYRAEFPDVKGQLRLVYVDGLRKVYDDGKLVAMQFKCDGCVEYKSVQGSVKQGHFKLCIDCWGEGCDICEKFFPPDQITKVDFGDDQVEDDWYLCKSCYDQLNTATDEEFDEVVAAVADEGETCEAGSLTTAKGILDGLTVDNMAIKLTAEDLEVRANFLYELLFEYDEKQIKAESWLEQAYSVSKECYRKNLTELRQGVPSTTSKALALRGSEDFLLPRSVGEATSHVESEAGALGSTEA